MLFSGLPSIARFQRAKTPGTRDYQLVHEIKHRAAELPATSDSRLSELAGQVRQRFQALPGNRAQQPDLIVETFALVHEAVRRHLGMTYYDVQLLAGIALTSNVVAEIATGEGKTLISALPAALGGFTSRGVHVATVNSYLAERDFRSLKKVYQCLGLSTGLVRDGDVLANKQSAYRADITYGTGYEFGFDYLRDQLCLQGENSLGLGQRFRRQLQGGSDVSQAIMQRGLHIAIIDEVDSVLIDEANTPLVISGAGGMLETNAEAFEEAGRIACALDVGKDFEVDQAKSRIELTDSGLDYIFQKVPTHLARPWNVYVEQALRASLLMQRDVHYVVEEGTIKIVDQYTGRIFDQRTWRDGLHQAVEVKESVAITPENRSLARISRQRFFQLYESVCGLSGTAAGHEQEFATFYGLDVVVIPEHRPCIRRQGKARFFATAAAKLEAAASAVRELHDQGTPVLVGTRTIAASRSLSHQLQQLAVPHELLNGVQDRAEAEVIACAGMPGAVTIATNMAGRGTDIALDDKSRELGGLHVLSLEFHDSRRIDRQLAGRAARQGDPGAVQFFASAEDELLREHGPTLAQSIIQNAATDGETRRSFEVAVRNLQAKLERQSFHDRLKQFQQQRWLDGVLATLAEPTVSTPSRQSIGDAA